MNTTYTAHVILFSPLPKPCSHAGRGGGSCQSFRGLEGLGGHGASGDEDEA